MNVIHALAVSVLALSLTACDKKESGQETKSGFAQPPKTVVHDASVQSLQEQVAQAKRRGHTAKEREDAANELRKAGGLSESEVQKAVSRM